MLGFAPLAAAPLGALGDGGVAYDAVIEESSAASVISFAGALFPNSVTAAAQSQDTAAVAASVFTPITVETVSSVDVETVLVVFASAVSEGGAGSDACLVAPSVFNAALDEQAQAMDVVLTSAVFFAAVFGGATTTDAVVRSLLWELIDTEQSTNWGNIDTNQSPNWHPVQTQN